MEIDILVNQLDSHNEANILATKRFNPKEVVFICNENDKSLIDSLKKYYETYLPQIIFKNIAVQEGDSQSLSRIINDNKNKNVIVNLTGGSRINSLELLNICKDNSIKAVYIDIKNKKLYEFDNKIEVINEEYEDLELDKLLKASGGEVINDSTELSNKKDLILLTKAIYKNLDIWHKYKQKLYEPNIFIHNAENPKEIKINSSLLDNEEKGLLNRILKKLKDMRGIDYYIDSNEEIKVHFKNEYLKSFIFKSGT